MKTEYKIALGLSILTSVCSMLIIAKTLKFGFILPAIAWGAIAWCYFKKNHQAVKYSLLVFGSIYAIGMAILVWGMSNTATTELDFKNMVVLTAAVVISPAVLSFQYFANEMQRREHEPEFAIQQQRTRVSAYVFVACVLGLMLNAIPDNKFTNTNKSSSLNDNEDTRILMKAVNRVDQSICQIDFKDNLYNGKIYKTFKVDIDNKNVSVEMKIEKTDGTFHFDTGILDNCEIVNKSNWKCGGQIYKNKINHTEEREAITMVKNGIFEFINDTTYNPTKKDCDVINVQLN